MQGNLRRDHLPDILHSINNHGKSGVLEVNQDRTSKSIYFGRGSMVFARSNQHSDRLGEYLVREGALSRSHLALASNKMRATGQMLGRSLVTLGLFTEQEMRARVAEQVRAIIFSMFAWSDGFYRFLGDAEPIAEDLTVELPTIPMILEGIRRMGEPETIRQAIGDLARPIGFSKDPRVIAHYINLTPQEGYVMSRVDGQATIGNILSMSPLSEDETLRCLYGLIAGGFLEPGAKSREVTPSAPVRQRPIEQFHGTPRGATPAPVSAPPATPKAITPEQQWVRDDIMNKFVSLSGGTFYDWLEIRKSSDHDAVKQGYLTMVKKYHPDRHRSAHLKVVASELQQIVSKVTEAYETLSDPLARRRYDNSLRTEAPRGERTTAAAKLKEEPKPPTFAEDMAARYYREASQYFSKREYHETVRLMEEAVELDGTHAEYHRLLAQALAQNPKWRRSSEEHFQKALKINRFDVETLLGLAELYELVGMTGRATALYEEALELDPMHRKLRGRI